MIYQFNTNEAKLYGVKCAVLLEFIRSKGGTIKMGLHEISDALPFLNKTQVRFGLKKLIDKNIISCYRTNPVTYSLNKIGEK